ncbi:MAG TPA: DUF4489 domain-containing protein [Candidatus Merdenecus merdavium]|nr:DUF4489 domain-containing protein [Candidatus Merdenecus merdavium]
MNQRRQTFPKNNLNFNPLFFPRRQITRQNQPYHMRQNGSEEKQDKVKLTEEDLHENEQIIEEIKRDERRAEERKLEETEIEQTGLALLEKHTVGTYKKKRAPEEMYKKVYAREKKEDKKKKIKQKRRQKIQMKWDKPTNQTYLKQSLMGSLTLMEGTAQNSTYIITNMNLNLSKLRRPMIKLEFGCNILTMDAVVTLSFQIFKQYGSQIHKIPLSSMWLFSRENQRKVETDTLSFQICDTESILKERCNYSVQVVVCCRKTEGTTIITNGTLTAHIIDSYSRI